ncbi:MAG: hypothetical protein LLF99_15165 [Desulfobacteraceae bacterium]|nr:hypothetical protein [Desulfobacteraceae bacterium]
MIGRIPAALGAGVFVFAFFLGLPAGDSGAGARKETLPERMDAVVKTSRELQKIKIADDLDPKVPSGAIGMLKQMKRQLRDLVTDWIDSPGAAGRSPQELESSLMAELAKRGLREADSGQHPYGRRTDVAFSRPEGHPDLLAATTTISIQCGSDTSFHLFERRNDRWRPVLALESDGYREISGAQGMPEFTVSPKDGEGRYFVAAADVSPWCTSNWQQLRFRILRPGADPSHPKILLERTESIFLGCDPPFTLRAQAGSCTLRYVSSQRLDGEMMTRPCVRTFQVTGDRVERTAPLALKPEDFLDEWTAMPWAEAARWSAPQRLEQMRGMHDALAAFLEEHFATLAFVQPCGGASPALWVIGVKLEEADRQGKPDALPAELFATIVSRGGAYVLQNMEGTRPADCPGETPAGEWTDPCEAVE